MNKFILTLATLCITLVTFSQHKEGRIDFELKFSSSDPMIQQQAAMMQGSKMIQYFAPEGTRTELNMGMFMNTTTIKNTKEKKTLTLTGGMMGNKAIVGEIETTKQQQTNTDFIVEKTNETKQILGLNCTKYVIDLGPEQGTTTIWATTEIQSEVGIDNQFSLTEIDGIPLLVEVENPQMNITITAVEFTKNLKKENKKKLFSLEIPKDYEVTTTEQMMEMIQD